jgi:3-mercaptopyruvate sulfurtransferase SseA
MMRRRVFIPALLALAAASAVLLGACKATDSAGNTSAQAKSAPSGTTEVHGDGVRRVTVAELQAMLEDGSAVIYDTRAKANYDTEHIKGSLSMPFDEVANRAGELPKDKTLVFYCT